MNLQPKHLQSSARPIELLELFSLLKKKRGLLLEYYYILSNIQYYNCSYLRKRVMETSRLEPEITICKIAVLPIKLCPLWYNSILSEKRLERSRRKPAKLKFALSTNSSTRIIYIFRYIAKPYLYILRREWFEHSSQPSWAVCFTN